MELIKNYNDDVLTVTVKDRVDTITSEDFKKEIFDEIGNFNSLILDFSQLEYISSAGLRVLIMIQKKLNEDDVDFVIINSNDQLKEIFTMSGIDKLLTIE